MRTRKPRKWDEADEDPAAGLVNLFDVWIAFAAALLLALMSFLNIRPKADAASGSPSQAVTDMVDPSRLKLEKYRVSSDKAGGDGQRLGTAYRLKSGEVIYVPDSGGGSKQQAGS